MTDELPHIIASSTLKIGSMELVCHVLSDGQRVFEAEGFEALMSAMLSDGEPIPASDLKQLANFYAGVTP